MKSQYATLLILSLAAAGCSPESPPADGAAEAKPNAAKKRDRSPEDMLPAGAIQIRSVDLQQVLPIYQELSIGTVDIAEPIKRMHAPISLTNNETMSRSQVLRLFEKALHDQAGIVATHKGTNRISLALECSP